MSGLSTFLLRTGRPSAWQSASPAARGAIHSGDSARDQEDWALAEEHYLEALEEDETLSGIWVQLGHMLKEQKKFARSLAAYSRASELDPSDPEIHVHSGHVSKRLARYRQAIQHFLAALYLGWESRGEESELVDLLKRIPARARFGVAQAAIANLDTLPPSASEAAIVTRLRSIVDQRADCNDDPATDDADTQPGDEGAATVFDISDLIGFWHRARLPTGIQRVQIEAIMAQLGSGADAERSVLLCCFTDSRDDWLGVPMDLFREVADLATASGKTGDSDWQQVISYLDLHLALTRAFVFPRGAMLVNLGTSWWLQNYFLYVRHAKEARGIRYVPFVHDMIPIMAPEHCTQELTRDFISWAIGVFDHADYFLANSEATRADLMNVAKKLGRDIDREDVAVIPLNSDFRKPAIPDLPESELATWDLEPAKFALFVSTIESRKGHLLAFEAWSQLIARHGTQTIPKLVCVGNQGWLNDRIYERLDEDSTLSEHVVMLSRLSDPQLALLYRTCAFTVYPSLYEGWGLPVTESLCYGKIPLSSDATSLPEAGEDFAVYFASGCQEDLAAKAERLILDTGYRRELEERVASQFRARLWSDVASQIGEELADLRRSDNGLAKRSACEPAAPLAHPGYWHPLTRNRATRVWRGMSSAEKYRSNLDWFWPEDRGCRVRNESGELAFALDRGHAGLRVYFRLRGDENEHCEYAISCEDACAQGGIEPDQSLWVWFDLPACSEPREYRITCKALSRSDGNRPTYFVGGFFLCASSNEDQRRRFMDAITLGRIDTLDAFGPEGPDSVHET